MINSLLFIVLFLIVICLISKKENYDNNGLLNVYNEPLKKCGLSGMSRGSWDSNGLCSEKGGGVHQICIQNIADTTDGFSKKTGQSNWSENRGKDNHCVCLGAWSLYNAKGYNNRNKVLKCDAIPKMSLSNDYVSKFSEGWNKWNGLELNNQIVNGVESLVKDCYEPNDPNPKYLNLRNNYCDFAKENKELSETDFYKNMCK